MPAPVQQNFGTQLAPISYSLGGQTASLGSTTAFTVTTAGFYEVNAAVLCTTAGSAGTVLVTTNTPKGGTIATGAASLTVLGTSLGTQLLTYLNAGDAVTYTTTVAGNVGGQYQVLINATQQQ